MSAAKVTETADAGTDSHRTAIAVIAAVRMVWDDMMNDRSAPLRHRMIAASHRGEATHQKARAREGPVPLPLHSH